MKKKTKKMIAPIIIVTILAIYYIAIGVYLSYLDGASTLTRIIALVIPAILAGMAIATLIQRIKEIRKGEDDDLSKY